MGCALWRQSATNDSVATAHEADSNSSPPERRSSSPYDGSVGISDLVAPSVTHSVIDFDVSSSTSRATSTPVSGPRQSRSVDDRSQQSVRSRDHADPTLSASSSRRGTRRNDERVMKSCFYPGPKSPDSPKMLTNDASVLVTIKRLQTCQGVLNGLKEEKDKMVNTNDEFQTAQMTTSIIPECALHKSASIITAPPVPGASVTAVDAKNNHTAYAQKMRPPLVPTQNNSSLESSERDGTECSDTFGKSDSAGGDSERIGSLDALQSLNRIALTNVKPNIVCHVDSGSTRPSVIPNIISTGARLKPEQSVDRDTRETRSIQPVISQTCSSLENSERDFGISTPNGSLHVDESSRTAQNPEVEGTSQLLPQREDVATTAVTAVLHSSLNSADNVEGAQLPASATSLQLSEHLARLQRKESHSSNNSFHLTKSWPLDLRDATKDNEQVLRLLDKDDNASESETRSMVSGDVSSSSEMYSQFGDLMNDTSRTRNNYNMSSPFHKSRARLHHDNGDNGEAVCDLNECAPQNQANVNLVNLPLQLENVGKQPRNAIGSESSSASYEPGREKPRFCKTMPQRLSVSSMGSKNGNIKSASDEGSPAAAYFLAGRRISTSPQHAEDAYFRNRFRFEGDKYSESIAIARKAYFQKTFGFEGDKDSESVAAAHNSSDVGALQMTAGQDDENVIADPQWLTKKLSANQVHYSKESDVVCGHQLECDRTEKRHPLYNRDFSPSPYGTANQLRRRWSDGLFPLLEDKELNMAEADQFQEIAAKLECEGMGCVGMVRRRDATGVGVKLEFRRYKTK
eukprot:GEMP01006538.1.p1 GENE.GEMP01006538.1~~GEMP01006538.1.p1  ORF type:complete len:801 (+),score=169.00 GEMP01006538.1:308-2710(+)